MPGVEANRRQWDGEYAWPHGGDEWSAGWGGSDAQWHSSLRPRLRRFLPAPTILEIAPGYGRWTQYLVACCDRYVGVDLSAQGVQACRRRFADVTHAEFHVNDGRTLTMIDDATIDCAFSFDSLVHVEEDVIRAYLNELARVLTPDGVAFLHHSNLAACKPVGRSLRLALRVAERALQRETPGFDHWRGTTMSARRFEVLAGEAGLACIGQEVVNWLSGRLIDCISLATPRGSRWERPNVVVHNPYFMAEAASSARAAQVHSDPSPPGPAEDGRSQHLGSLSRIVSAPLGPWGVTVEGPLPTRWRR
jgi:ubiquinone/menaquinone biosynthesis C-methylase UbiE